MRRRPLLTGPSLGGLRTRRVRPELPLIATLIASIKTDGEISSNPSLAVEQPTLVNYQKIFAISDRFDILHFLGNSLAAAGLGSVLALVLAFPAAYAIVRYKVGQTWLLPAVTNLRASR